MAYAQLAGLPAYYGLYAAFLPPIIAALFGSSRQLATGPVAIVSLMTSAALEPIVASGSPKYVVYAVLLAFSVGLFQIVLVSLRLGFLINFLSHPVVNGFTNAAAIIIATSQLPKIFGVSVEKGEHHYETVYFVIKDALYHTHLPTLGFAVFAFIIMFVLKKYLPKIPYVLIAVIICTIISYYSGYYQEQTVSIAQVVCPISPKRIKEYNDLFDSLESKLAQRVELNNKLRRIEASYGEFSKQHLDIEFSLTILNLDIEKIKEKIVKLREQLRVQKFIARNEYGKITFCNVNSLTQDRIQRSKVFYLKVQNKKFDLQSIRFNSGADRVGKIPQGFPQLKIPRFDFNIFREIFSYVAIISLLGFLEAISIAKAMAAKTGQSLNFNQELIGQGLGNLFGSFFQSYPVSGSFSRSAVNFQLGATTGVSSVVTGLFVGISLIFFAPLLYYLPQSVLAAIIILAVIGSINIHGFLHDWKAQKYDGIIGVITFITTLYFAPHIDYGIFIGVILSLALYIHRGMKPEIAFLSKHPDTTFRNRMRFGLAQCKHIAVIRYNCPLVFKNVNYLENTVLRTIANMPELKYVVVVGNAINEFDAS
ncbi:MAG: SulP family inorganic anion transporter, partial [Candidatus Kapaibacteriota bacterium]